MKRLNNNGSVSIISFTLRSRSHKFDGFVGHAHNTFFSGGASACASGAAVIVWTFVLNDGTQWFYLSTLFPNTTEGNLYWDAYHEWVSPNNYVGYQGEYFNAILRPVGGSKATLVEYFAYLSSH